MTLLYSCPACGYAHDIKLKIGKPISVKCPNCEKEYYLELKIWKKEAKYYGINSDG